MKGALCCRFPPLCAAHIERPRTRASEAIRDAGMGEDMELGDRGWEFWLAVCVGTVAAALCVQCCCWLCCVGRRYRRATARRPDAAPSPLRFGVLGAATIAPSAIVQPAAVVPGVVVHAIAARSRAKAEAFARAQGIPVVHDSYEALIDDADVDAVYIPLPNGLHAQWALRAIAAGKHVLVEKPLASNRAEAERVRDAARAAGVVAAEAFHYRHHPAARRAREIATSGELGRIRRIKAAMAFPARAGKCCGMRRSDIRLNWGLAGGCLMDTCYTVNALRYIAGEEPVVEAAGATMLPGSTTIDTAMTATFNLPLLGATGEIHSSFVSSGVDLSIVVEGDRATMRLSNFVLPFLWHRISVTPAGAHTCGRCCRRGRRVETAYEERGWSTYALQLAAFVRAVREGDTESLACASLDEAVANMAVVDAVYAAAGLPTRGSAAASETPESQPGDRDGLLEHGAGAAAPLYGSQA